MAHRKLLDFDSASPRLIKVLNPIRRKDQIKIEWTILELHEIFAPDNLDLLRVSQVEL